MGLVIESPHCFVEDTLVTIDDCVSSWMGDRLGGGIIRSTRQLSSLGEIV